MSTPDPSWPGPWWRRPLDRRVARHRDGPVVRGMTRWLEGALEVLRAADHDPDCNGERNALSSLAPDASVVFDVGANVGKWARLAHRACPRATIHAFEIAEPTRVALAQATGDLGRVRVADVGLSDRRGSVRVKHYPSHSQVTSLVDYPHPIPSEWRIEPVLTGDAYLAATDIDHVDYLKIDVEGAELAVLRGFERALRHARIGAVQFEHGRAGIVARTFLRDFYELLEPLGYTIGRVRRTGVEPTRYRLRDESFVTANYVAFHEPARS
jgi:FkbM family methyltransferase